MAHLKLTRLNLASVLEEDRYRKYMYNDYPIKSASTKVIKEEFKKTPKRVTFNKNAKQHDGPELPKQIVEYIIYNYFETLKIKNEIDIKYVLKYKFNNPETSLLKRIVELFDNTISRLKEASEGDKVQLFNNTTGQYGLIFYKKHLLMLIDFYNLFIRSLEWL